MNHILLRNATKEEVRRAILKMHTGKALGPNGMTTIFFQHSFPIIKKDLLDLVSNFFWLVGKWTHGSILQTYAWFLKQSNLQGWWNLGLEVFVMWDTKSSLRFYVIDWSHAFPNLYRKHNRHLCQEGSSQMILL